VKRKLKYTKAVILILSLAVIPSTIIFAGGEPLTSDSVIFQAFYWDVDPGGIWYDRIRDEAPGLKAAGFTHFWFPPPTKGAGGGYSMGYDLYDNYDLGQYDQKGTVETRFGSLAELQAAAAACENVLLDLVANHMDGAEAEEQDSGDGNWYWQKFNYVHGLFPKSTSDFHPGNPDDCDLCNGNDYILGQDVCHNNPYMFNGQLAWAQWMKDTIGNVSGFRLDAVKHFSWEMSKQFGTVGDCIGEFWDSQQEIFYWMDYTGNYAFDFPLFYTMKDSNAAALDGAGLTSAKGISFVANHDTERDSWISQKSRAYGFILYINPIPCVFWSDWFNGWLQPQIQRALTARHAHDFGGTQTIYKNGDLIIFRNNTPVFGCFNSHGINELSATVGGAAPNSIYSAIAWGPGDQPADVTSDLYGNVTLSAPAGGYAYWYRDPEKNGPLGRFGSVHVTGNNEPVFGSEWGYNPANEMTLVSDHVWRWIVDVPEATSVEYKFLMNGSWDVNRGLGETTGPQLTQFNWHLTQHGGNIPLNLPAGWCVWEYYDDTETNRVYTVDFNSDHVVNLIDYSYLAAHWLHEDCNETNSCETTDMDRNGAVDKIDLLRFQEFYLVKPIQ
jgi:alpha-amylase